jgi:hypothetical protein
LVVHGVGPRKMLRRDTRRLSAHKHHIPLSLLLH